MTANLGPGKICKFFLNYIRMTCYSDKSLNGVWLLFFWLFVGFCFIGHHFPDALVRLVSRDNEV